MDAATHDCSKRATAAGAKRGREGLTEGGRLVAARRRKKGRREGKATRRRRSGGRLGEALRRRACRSQPSSAKGAHGVRLRTTERVGDRPRGGAGKIGTWVEREKPGRRRSGQRRRERQRAVGATGGGRERQRTVGAANEGGSTWAAAGQLAIRRRRKRKDDRLRLGTEWRDDGAVWRQKRGGETGRDPIGEWGEPREAKRVIRRSQGEHGWADRSRRRKQKRGGKKKKGRNELWGALGVKSRDPATTKKKTKREEEKGEQGEATGTKEGDGVHRRSGGEEE